MEEHSPSPSALTIETPDENTLDGGEPAAASAKRQGTLSRFLTPTRKSEKIAPHVPSSTLEATIHVGEGRKVKVDVEIDSSGQHSLTWAEPIKLPVSVDSKPATRPPGKCNLYMYPKVFFDHLRKGKGVVPPGADVCAG